jgi:hypothetical protein
MAQVLAKLARGLLYGLLYLLLGVLGIGRPIVDREEMYGDDPRSDPYDPEFDPDRRRGR